MKFSPRIKVPAKATKRQAIGMPSKVVSPAPKKIPTTTDPFTRKHIVVRDLEGAVLFDGSGPQLRKWFRKRKDDYRKGRIYGPRPAGTGF